MKRLFFFTYLAIFLFAFALPLIAQTNPNHVYVKSYTRKDGTYVRDHYRTAPNSTNSDNFSTRGNYNPYTGQAGWIEPDNKPNAAYEYTTPPKQTQVFEPPSYQKQTSSGKRDSPVFIGSGIREVFSCSSLLEQPNSSAKEIDKACNGKVYVIGKYNNQYYKVTNGSTEGYLPLSSFKTVSYSKPKQNIEFTKKYTYTESKHIQTTQTHHKKPSGTWDVYNCAVIYNQPNQYDAKEIGRACNGSVYVIRMVDDNYYRIKYESIIGYVHSNSLK